ncbi:MAG: hypothetical protein NTW38_09055 [Candidatus Aminicenantes bacterium]|nr:hypothetical protein [Candidatus Aminicenantes bacterium]
MKNNETTIGLMPTMIRNPFLVHSISKFLNMHAIYGRLKIAPEPKGWVFLVAYSWHSFPGNGRNWTEQGENGSEGEICVNA